MNKLLTVILTALLSGSLTGCDSDVSTTQAYNEFDKRCKGKVTAEYNKGDWNDYFTLKCDDFDPTTKTLNSQ